MASRRLSPTSDIAVFWARVVGCLAVALSTRPSVPYGMASQPDRGPARTANGCPTTDWERREITACETDAPLGVEPERAEWMAARAKERLTLDIPALFRSAIGD